MRRERGRARRRHGRPGRPRRVDEAALARERAFLGALVLQPEAIRWLAARRPPWSFLDPRSVDVMQALVCLAHGTQGVSVDRVTEALEAHEVLARVGGRAFVESLVEPSQELSRAQAQLRERFVPVEEEPIVIFMRRLLGDGS